MRFGPKKDVFGPPTAPTQPNVRTCETAVCSAAAPDFNQPGSDSFRLPAYLSPDECSFIRGEKREREQRVQSESLSGDADRRSAKLNPPPTKWRGKKIQIYIFKGSGREMFVTLLGRELKCEPSKNCTRSYASK